MAFISTVRHRNFYSLIRRKLYKQDASKYDVERVAREKESELADGFYGTTGTTRVGDEQMDFNGLTEL